MVMVSSKVQKAFAITSFSLVMTSLLVAIITDFAIFSEAILTFVAAIILSGIAFVVLFIAMIVTIIFIFGVVLLQQYGFWPLNLSVQFFKEIIGSATISYSQLTAFLGVRIAILVLCIIGVVLASIAKHRNKESKDKPPLKGLSVVATIFGIIGIVVAIGMILITAFALQLHA